METPFEQRMKFLDSEEAEEHVELKQRLKKTLYYGKMKNMDRPSLAMTELAVEFLQELAPKELGRIDMYWASSLSRDVSVTPCALMLALMYAKRLKHNNSQYLSQVSSSDLFLISVLVASKYLYDEGESDDVSNIQWACLTKTDVEDINENERSFLNAMEWKIFVKPDDFWNFLSCIETKVAWKMSTRRNNFTYSDLSVLVSIHPLCQILYNALVELCKVFVVCSVTYVAGLTTLFLSNVMPALCIHAFVPLSSVPGVAPEMSSSVGLLCCYQYFSVAKPVLDISVQQTLTDIASDVTTSCLDHPQFCKPQRSDCSPKTCVRASFSLTFALLRELMLSTCYLMTETMSAIVAGYSLRYNTLVNQNFKHCLSDGSRCNVHDRCHGSNFKNTRLKALSSNSSEVNTICGPANECQLPTENQESKVEWQNSLICVGTGDQNLFTSSCNYSTPFSGVSSLYQTTAVFG